MSIGFISHVEFRNGCVALSNLGVKGNLAHKFAGPYFLCFFLFDLDVFNTLKRKNIGNNS